MPARTFLAAAAILAVPAYAAGTAYVENKCPYPVYLSNVPADGNGYETTSDVVQPGGSWSHAYQKTVMGGMSIKLGKESGSNDVTQFEYTYTGLDGFIWYDMSWVNGNPFGTEWEFSATGDCDPKKAAYRTPKDDQNGMQKACPEAASVTCTLCPGGSDDGSSPASPSESDAPETSAPAETSAAIESSAPVETSVPAPTSYEAPSSTVPAPVASSSSDSDDWWSNGGWSNVNKNVQVEASPSPTTFATVKTSSVAGQGYAVTVTEVATEVVTNIVTMAAPAAKRHEHHPRHPHHHA